MKSSARYATTGTGVVALAVLLFWPFLDPIGRQGILVAALVALPIQIVSYAVLQHYRGELTGFLAAWVGGTLVRMVAVGVVAFLVIRSGTEMAIPMLLALVSFFFALLLLEPIYFRSEQQGTS